MGDARPSGVPVVKVGADHSYQLDEAALERVLLREEVRDLPVAVISVAGAYRGGKSFLLDFCLRYLMSPNSSRNESGEWLGDPNTPLTGFSWRGGSERHTTGIVMWSEPFVVNLPNDDKVAVILMDTQGTFDSKSTVRDCSTIFALSTLLSSVQIYNIKENIKEDDLQHLQLFTEYGRLIRSEDGGKAFQVLQFLVRDWPYFYEHAYGRAGGDALLEKRFEITDSLPLEMRELRQHIRSSFETVTCFLMPHPGFGVMNPKFDGRLSEVGIDFKNSLQELVPSIFAPSNLTLKLINGERVKARDLLNYFKTYMKIFNSDEIPSPVSIMKATSEAGLLSAARLARELYEASMERVCGATLPSVPRDVLTNIHHTALDAARASFTTKKKMGSQKDVDAYLAQLTQDLEARLPQYMLMNEAKVQKAIAEAKEAYESSVRSVHGKEPLCLHPLDLKTVHNEALAAATRVFDSKRKQFMNIKDEERTNFIQSFDKAYELLRATNEQNNRTFAVELRSEYATHMQDLCAKEPPLDDDDFEKEHRTALNKALDTFKRRRNRTSDYDEDVYRDGLSQKIVSQFISLQTINRSKNRKAFQQALDLYGKYMKQFWDPTTCCLHPADLKAAHETAMGQALRMFHPNHASSYNSEDDFEKNILTQIMQFTYRELCDLNDAGNESAISAALNEYTNRMDNDTAPTGWWVFIVPMIVQLTRKSTYHKKAKEAALSVFYGKRRNTMNPEWDRYFDKLVERIDRAYRNY